MKKKKKTTRNLIAKELRTSKYRQKKIPNKKKSIINKKYKYEECN
tara:strand:+ start:483 stop:617 length:135 start_codon:yes stop_codon:yes gene_type:complete